FGQTTPWSRSRASRFALFTPRPQPHFGIFHSTPVNICQSNTTSTLYHRKILVLRLHFMILALTAFVSQKILTCSIWVAIPGCANCEGLETPCNARRKNPFCSAFGSDAAITFSALPSSLRHLSIPVCLQLPRYLSSPSPPNSISPFYPTSPSPPNVTSASSVNYSTASLFLRCHSKNFAPSLRRRRAFSSLRAPKGEKLDSTHSLLGPFEYIMMRMLNPSPTRREPVLTNSPISRSTSITPSSCKTTMKTTAPRKTNGRSTS
ncbi:hypothetical protein B0H13DRAFT_2524645, partial [Mycena leptocephala]